MASSVIIKQWPGLPGVITTVPMLKAAAFFNSLAKEIVPAYV